MAPDPFLQQTDKRVMTGSAEEADAELMGWIREAAAPAA